MDYFDEKLNHQKFWWKINDFDGVSGRIDLEIIFDELFDGKFIHQKFWRKIKDFDSVLGHADLDVIVEGIFWWKVVPSKIIAEFLIVFDEPVKKTNKIY